MLERLRVGPIGENAYILPGPASGPGAGEGGCVLVDPGDEARRILDFLDGRSLVPTTIVATHGHLDHTAAIPDLLEALAARGRRARLAVHAGDAAYFGELGEATNRELFASIRAIGFFKHYWKGMPAPDLLLADGDAVPGSAYRVIHTPGHSAGSCCLYDGAAGILVSGDTLFRDGVGRTDGPDSDPRALAASLRRILALPPGTKVFPGHGEPTTIGAEAAALGLGAS